jgi:AraC family transcriptional regulator of adaptative response/methylated-DNA-[protein]-cysteine methyltransferase
MTATAADAKERWAAVMARDRGSDGKFFYSVRTTGVYCRPSCASGLPRPENVLFHDTALDAERAGFRPCRRCRPERTRDAGMEIRVATAKCSLGQVLLARSEKGICAILLGDRADSLKRDLRERFPLARRVDDDPETEKLLARVVRTLENPRLAIDLPLDLRGTKFQRRVWEVLGTIRPGSTVSYAEVARRIGAPRAVRAVAQACGANPLAVVIPCHRVVRSDGALSGYRWGARRKRALLEREARR